MTRNKNIAKKLDLKEVLAEQEDFLRGLIQQVVQQVLEAEMDDALSAEKGQRTPNRLGYRSGHYSRTLTTRVGKLDLRYRRIGRGGSGRRCLSVTSGVRKRWWARWLKCMYKECRRARSRR